MPVVNTDAKSHSVKPPEKCLQEAERSKKIMYLYICLQHRRHFSPFFASVDVLLGVEATATLKRISSRLATKWRQPYSQASSYVNSRISVTLVRPHIGESEDLWCKRIVAACSPHSGKTVPG